MKTKEITLQDAIDYLWKERTSDFRKELGVVSDIPLKEYKEAVKRKYHKELVRTTTLPYKEIHAKVRALDFSF